MRTTIPTPGPISGGRRLRLAAIALGLLLVFGFAQTAGAQSATAADPPLTFAQNYLVRGDYVVAGAYNMTSTFTVINGNQYAVGTINIPDIQNKGIQGQNMVPAGAEVVAAVLYWQTVEKIGVTPGGPGSGQSGFFRPIIKNSVGAIIGPPSPGYVIGGVSLTSGGTNTVSWSSGGCTSGSTGKVIKTYRANVLAALPVDKTGNIIVNGSDPATGNTYGTFEVRLPGTASTTPIALGATLVLIYRVFDPNAMLNAIVIYDGDFAPSNTSLTMMQKMQGFYDAATTVSKAQLRVTQIVGNGKSKKMESISLNGQGLLSLYPGQPPFPGFYGAWDNATWTFFGPTSNLIAEHSDFATVVVTPSSSQQGCVSWGASIISTTANSSAGDGLVDSWKTNQGYCDAVALDAGTCSRAGDPGWVDLPNAATPASGTKDVYVQLDYMCSSPNPDGNTCKTGDGINYSFDPRLTLDPLDVDPLHPNGKSAVDKVVAAYAAHGITLHVNESLNRPNVANVHAIPEPYCQDIPGNPPSLCIFPNPPGTTINRGVIAWPGGVDTFERQLIDPDEPTKLGDCTTSTREADCIPRFQPGAAISKHEVIFAHAVGQPKWSLQDGTLMSVAQSGNMVTFTTKTEIGTLNSIGTNANGNIPDPTCLNTGRVTIIGAATNPNLNGTYCVQFSTKPTDTTLTITIGGNSQTGNYNRFTDPNLAVVPGFTSTASGVADVGGHRLVVSLGLWGDPASPTSDGQNPKVIGGTWMHELGHAAASLAHGGPAAGAGGNPALFQSVITNCKPNYLSVMSYSRQVDGAVDYSGGTLSPLDKSQGGNLTGADSAITNWYVPWPAFFAKDSNGNSIPVGSAAKLLCNGFPIPPNTSSLMTRVTGLVSTFSFLNSQDINFDGNTTETLPGADDWDNADFAQTSATGSASSSSGQSFGGGGQSFGGGGQSFGGGGQSFGGGGQSFGGGGQSFGGGGQSFGGGGQSFGGGGEADLATQDSVTHTIQDLKIVSEAKSPRTITLQWSKPFGDIGAYNVYRSKDGGLTFTRIATVAGANGNPPATTFTDTPQGIGPTCNPTGYQYFVTAVQSITSPFPGQESTQSNTVSTILPDITHPVTGCYNPPVFSSPAAGSSPLQGSTVQITWQVPDDFYGTFANNPGSNTLVAIGPISDDVVCTTAVGPRTTLTSPILFDQNTNLFSLNWNTSQGFQGVLAQPFPQGCYRLELDLDSGQPTAGNQPASAFQVQIYLADVNESVQVATTSLPDGVVGSAYNQAFIPTGGVGAVVWSFSGTLPSGINLNANGTLTGTPTTPGTYTFTVKVTDSIGDFGTQALTLRVADALYGDLIVVDGSPSLSPSGRLFRITPDGAISATIASISNGSPTGVAVDPNTGNIFVAVALGTPRIVEVTRFGTVSDFVPGDVLTGPVAVAVDNPGNVYVGDNNRDAIYKFNSSGMQVDAIGNTTTIPFASLPGSLNTLQDIRMAFDSAGNLIVASDAIGDVGGVVEVDKITPTGAFSVLYNTLTNSTLTDALTAVSNASGGNTTYTGTFSPILPAGSAVTISGFTNAGNNNGQFKIVSCTSTQLVVNNPAGMAETNPGTATFNPSGLSLAIGTVGGIAVFSDGSIDVADFAAKSIFKITAPGTATMAITTAISGPGTLCCNISGMANPPSQVNTTLYVTLNGVGGPPTRLQLAVPETNSVTTVLSGVPLTFANDVTWFQPRATYYVDGFGNFGTLDLTAGVTKVIGTGTVSGNTGLDLTPTGQVYEYNISNQLIQVNPTTGAATMVASGTLPNPGFTTTGGLTNGSYFGIDALSGNLYSINLTTGATTLVGLTTTAKRPSGCGFETSLAGSANVLYYTIGFGGKNCTAPMNDTLYQIDPTTGTTMTIGQVSVNGFVGSAFVGGKLYGFTFGGQEYSINPATGVATFLTNTTAAVFGAASH